MSLKRRYLIFFILAAFVLGFAACDKGEDSTYGAKTYKVKDNWSGALSVKETLDGGIIFAGFGDHGFWAAKLDSDLNIQWEKAYNVGNSMHAKVLVLDDGSYILSSLTVYGEDEYNPYSPALLKIDGDGNVLWHKVYSYEKNGFIHSLAKTPDGGFIFAARTQPDYLGWIVKTDSSGTIEWQKKYNGTGRLYSVRPLPSGGYAACGTWKIAGRIGYRDAFIMTIDAKGNVIKAKNYGVEDTFIDPKSIDVLADGSFIVAGSYHLYENETDYVDCWVMKVNSELDVVWQKRYDYNSNDDSVYYMEKTSDGGAALTGYGRANTSFFSAQEILCYKIDTNGNIEWEKTYRFDGGYVYGYEIHETDYGYLVAGKQSAEAFVMKINDSGDMPGLSKIISNASANVYSTSVETNAPVVDAVDTDGKILEPDVIVTDTNAAVTSY